MVTRSARSFVLLPCLAVCFAAGCSTRSSGPAPSQPTAASPTLPPTGDLTVAPGFTKLQRSGTAGGAVENTRSCRGFFPDVAQHRLTIEKNLLETTLEVDHPDAVLWIAQAGATGGGFCGGAVEGPARVGRGAWSAGTYEVKVGTRTTGKTAPYVLSIREGK